MQHVMMAALLTALAGVAGAAAQTANVPAGETLGTVRITDQVLAQGKPLAPGTYELRLLAERPMLAAGQPSDTQRYIVFIAGGSVAARETAEVFAEEASTPPGSPRSVPVVQRLRGDEFVRISVRRGLERLLIYLPLAPPAAR